MNVRVLDADVILFMYVLVVLEVSVHFELYKK